MKYTQICVFLAQNCVCFTQFGRSRCWNDLLAGQGALYGSCYRRFDPVGQWSAESTAQYGKGLPSSSALYISSAACLPSAHWFTIFGFFSCGPRSLCSLPSWTSVSHLSAHTHGGSPNRFGRTFPERRRQASWLCLSSHRKAAGSGRIVVALSLRCYRSFSYGRDTDLVAFRRSVRHQKDPRMWRSNRVHASLPQTGDSVHSYTGK